MIARIAVVLLALAFRASAAEDSENSNPGLNTLPEIEFAALSQHDPNPLGAKALLIRPADWKHSETEHFVYHFIHGYVATPVSVEAEFNFRVITKELGRDGALAATGKSHVYIFEKPDDWKIFQTSAQLEPWTGGIHSRGSLFIVRDPALKFADHSLGHEIAHLILFRLYGRELPRWLDEGFAEYISRISQASFERARNFVAHARSHRIPAAEFIPLERLTTMDYPSGAQVGFFYAESERLVRYLISADRSAFLALLDAIGGGEEFDTALSRNYGAQFFDVAALETQFVSYASQDASR